MKTPPFDAPLEQWQEYLQPGVWAAFHETPERKAELKTDRAADQLVLSVDGRDHILATRQDLARHWFVTCPRIYQIKDHGEVTTWQS